LDLFSQLFTVFHMHSGMRTVCFRLRIYWALWLCSLLLRLFETFSATFSCDYFSGLWAPLCCTRTQWEQNSGPQYNFM